MFLSSLLGPFADAAMSGSFDLVWKLALGTLACIFKDGVVSEQG